MEDENELKKADNDVDEYNKLLAAKIHQKETDPDLDSLQSPGAKTKRINNIFHSDIASVFSSVTNLTNNTCNNQYHNDDASIDSNASSSVSDTTIQSIQDADINDMLDSGMSLDEINQNITIIAARLKMNASQKADKMIART